MRNTATFTEDDFTVGPHAGTMILSAVFRCSLMSLVNWPKFFPVMLLVCNASASVCYAVAGDFRRSLYWAASTICVGAVTF